MRRKSVRKNWSNPFRCCSPFPLPSVGPVVYPFSSHAPPLPATLVIIRTADQFYANRLVPASSYLRSFSPGNLHTRISAPFRRRGLNAEGRLTCLDLCKISPSASRGGNMGAIQLSPSQQDLVRTGPRASRMKVDLEGSLVLFASPYSCFCSGVRRPLSVCGGPTGER